MNIKKILIYGSSHLTQITCLVLKDYYDLVGHVPSINPTIAGSVDLPVVDETIEHDIKLSIQYNSKIHNPKNAYNIHTGLLPNWGGTDILYHTIKDKNQFEQGLTFHKMTDKFDYGNILSKMTYPVNHGDTIIDLYSRVSECCPLFVLNCLKLLETFDDTDIDEFYKEAPKLFKRGNVDEADLEMYSNTLNTLKNKFETTS